MESLQQFEDVGVAGLLNADNKPTFVLDSWAPESETSLATAILFKNLALLASEPLLDIILSTSLSAEATGFRRWASLRDRSQDQHVYLYQGIQWSSFIVQDRWKVLCGQTTASFEDQNIMSASKVNLLSLTGDFEASRHDHMGGFPPQLSMLAGYSHMQTLQNFDWEAAGILQSGLVNQQFLSMLEIVLMDPDPAILFWGKDLLMFYNEAYMPVAGTKHPELLGLDVKTGFLEAWDEFGPLFKSLVEHKKAMNFKQHKLLLDRSIEENIELEETYFSFSFIPLLDVDSGEIIGILEHLTEATQQVLSRRRIDMLLRISQACSGVDQLSSVFTGLRGALGACTDDVSLGALYVLEPSTHSNEDDSGTAEEAMATVCTLEWTVGTAPHLLPPNLSTTDLSNSLASIFQHASRTNKPLITTSIDRDFPRRFFPEVQGSISAPAAVKTLFVLALRAGVDEDVRAFLVLGWNPRQPLGPDLLSFISLLEGQINSCVASSGFFENILKRSRDSAATAVREARASATRLDTVAMLAPVGIVIVRGNGSILYANEKWYELTGHPRDEHSCVIWSNYILAEDHGLVEQNWKRVKDDRQHINYEIRLKPLWYGPDKEKPFEEGIPTWVLISAYAEVSDSGNAQYVACMTQINDQKWAQEQSQRRTQEISEAKIQQDNFIDMTSHEIRNPLGVIMQCADAIVDTLSSYSGNNELSQMLSTSIDQANTILHCADHQKRIVDDILTLSKINSNLVTFAPADTDAVIMVQNTLAMLKHQAEAADVKLMLDVAPGLLANNSTRFDASRVMQILINLITNAIKFTQKEPTRNIVVKADAIFSPPESLKTNKTIFCEPRDMVEDASLIIDAGERIYLSFEVHDTGRGISLEEQQKLFERFSQASPKTHVTYGGSGLGLFLSRKLAELQGGRMGFRSNDGEKGSVFAFYIQAARLASPKLSPATPTTAMKRNSLASGSALQSPDTTMIGALSALAVPSSSLTSSSSITTNPLNPSQTPNPPRTTNLSILLVEDNLINQRILSTQLRRQGYTTHVAGNGLEALEFLSTRTNLTQSTATYTSPRDTNQETPNGNNLLDISVVLLDVETPIMDGLTCIRQIRELQAQGVFKRHVPVVAITANARLEQVAVAFEAGMDAVVSKPFRVAELLGKVDELLFA